MKRVLSLTLALVLSLSLAACGAPAASGDAASGANNTPRTEASPTTDRGGAVITLPDSVQTVIVLAPSIAETLIAMGDGDKIIAVDTQTKQQNYPELSAELPAFDLTTPDLERLAALKPDVVLASGLSIVNGENPFQPIIDLGVNVACVPTSESIADIQKDISFLGAVMNRTTEAKAINDTMQKELDRISAIGKTVAPEDQKTVYFEIAAAPMAYSFGSGVFLNEMIELIGAKNVFAAEQSWMSVEGESALAANPDVVLTNVNYIEDAVGEIKTREGWDAVTAVKNGDVYYIDNMASSLANQNIIKALEEMAVAVYPELYKK